ncbi:hypothetical protein SZ39_2616 [Bacillus mycoides]|nr:hypothetical protein SZ39_2616 [Bacillus mycoides]
MGFGNKKTSKCECKLVSIKFTITILGAAVIGLASYLLLREEKSNS